MKLSLDEDSNKFRAFESTERRSILSSALANSNRLSVATASFYKHNNLAQSPINLNQMNLSQQQNIAARVNYANNRRSMHPDATKQIILM